MLFYFAIIQQRYMTRFSIVLCALLFVASLALNAQDSLYVSKDAYYGKKKNGLPHGFGTFTWGNGQQYSGTWREGQMNGEGTMKYLSGDSYQGQWMNGLKHGYGIYTWKDGSVYRGFYNQGKRDGEGEIMVANGPSYKGFWKEDLPHGEGAKQWPNGDFYEGGWKEGKRHGIGVMEYADGSIEQGEFVDDKYIPCNCTAKETTMEAYASHDAVFVGTIEDIIKDENGNDRLVMMVTHYWKGVLGVDRRVMLLAGTTSCDFIFFQDVSYLVYAKKGQQGYYQVTKCSRSGEADTKLLDIATLDAEVPCKGDAAPYQPSAYAADPVCGCDGKQYRHADDAKQQGVKVWKKGECK
jgi:hypothetical protein